jgi:hypothetical protein
MFKKQEGALIVERPVVIHKPQDGDGFAKYRIRLRFEILGRAEIDRLQEEFEAGNPDTDWLNKVVKGGARVITWSRTARRPSRSTRRSSRNSSTCRSSAWP